MNRLLVPAVLVLSTCGSPAPEPPSTPGAPSESIVAAQVVIRVDTGQSQMTATAASAQLLPDAIVFPHGARLSIEAPVRAVANCGTLVVSDGGAVCDNGVEATFRPALREDP